MEVGPLGLDNLSFCIFSCSINMHNTFCRERMSFMQLSEISIKVFSEAIQKSSALF